MGWFAFTCRRVFLQTPTVSELNSRVSRAANVVENKLASAAEAVKAETVHRAKRTRNWIAGVVLTGVFLYGLGSATPGAVKEYLKYRDSKVVAVAPPPVPEAPPK